MLLLTTGSGIVTACERLHEQEPDEQTAGESRITKLAQFQLAALLKALSFPGAERVVYSTCSVHMAENEHVVASALQQQQQCNVAQGDTWQLANCLPAWYRRGLHRDSIRENSTSKHTDGDNTSLCWLTPEQADCVARTLPEDRTNGFFVALFVRRGSAASCCEASNSSSKRKQGVYALTLACAAG